MRKLKLVPVALAALTLSGVAAAQTDSSVQIYGQVTAGITEQNNQTASHSSQYTEGNNEFAVSLLGFRGTEDLGDGMKALFRLETGINSDTGTSTVASKFWNRQSYVGLNFANLGEVTLGRQFTASTDRMIRTLDIYNVAGNSVKNTPFALFGVNKYASAAANPVASTQSPYDNRSDDTVKYRVNGPAGLQFGASYGFDDGEGRSYALDIGQGNKDYQIGALWVRFEAPFAFGGHTPTQETWALGGNVAVGPVRVYATYLDNQADGATAALLGKPKQEDKVLELGARWNVLVSVDLTAAYYHDQGTAVDNVVGRNGTKNTWVAAVDYYLSKRTSLNAGIFSNSLDSQYGKDAVNNNALNQIAAPGTGGYTTTGYTVGIRHVF